MSQLNQPLSLASDKVQVLLNMFVKHFEELEAKKVVDTGKLKAAKERAENRKKKRE